MSLAQIHVHSYGKTQARLVGLDGATGTNSEQEMVLERCCAEGEAVDGFGPLVAIAVMDTVANIDSLVPQCGDHRTFAYQGDGVVQVDHNDHRRAVSAVFHGNRGTARRGVVHRRAVGGDRNATLRVDDDIARDWSGLWVAPDEGTGISINHMHDRTPGPGRCVLSGDADVDRQAEQVF